MLLKQAAGVVSNTTELQRSPQEVIEQSFAGMPLRFQFVGIYLMTIAALTALFHKSITWLLLQLPDDYLIVRAHLKNLVSSIKKDFLLILLITCIGGAIRANFLSQPIRIDEAATYTEFISKPLYNQWCGMCQEQ